MLEVEGVSKSFHDGDEEVVVLDDVNLLLDKGQSAALLGDSGSGKTTFLQIAAGLEEPDTGRVSIDGAGLSQLTEGALSMLRRRDIGFVFQQFNLIPGLDVHSNLLFQRRLNGLPDEDSWVDELIVGLELESLLTRPIEVLSGGQQQRLAIARALAHRPGMVFADEPTGNLNDALSQKVMALFARFVEEAGAALLLVTHNEALAQVTQRQLRLVNGALQPAVTQSSP